MGRGIGYNYYQSMDDNSRNLFLETLHKLYIDENLTMKEISDKLGLDFNIIRYFIRNNIGGNLKKSKDKKYEVIFDHYTKTCNEKYGGHPMRTDQVKENLRNTFYRKYGIYHNKQIGKTVNDINSLYDKDKLKDIILSLSPGDRTIENIMNITNYSSTPVLAMIKKFELDGLVDWKSTDFPESEIRSFLERNIPGIDISLHYHGWSKKHSSRYEIDLFCKDYNIGIEFNGIYYHQIKYKGSMYHQEKSLDALDNNIFIYHIWENDWYDPNKRKIIESQLLNLFGKTNRRIYARDCIVREISSSVSRDFLNRNHIHGDRSAKYKYGLFYNDKLVSVMTFGDNYFIRKNHDIELLRFATLLNTIVIGGASKLFKHFIREHNPDKVISYCYIDSGRGNVYKNLGFKLVSITPPNYFWVDKDTGETITRYRAQNMNESEMANSSRYFKLSNSGNYKFEWNKVGESNDSLSNRQSK